MCIALSSVGAVCNEACLSAHTGQFHEPEGMVISLFTPVTEAALTRFGSR